MGIQVIAAFVAKSIHAATEEGSAFAGYIVGAGGRPKWP